MSGTVPAQQSAESKLYDVVCLAQKLSRKSKQLRERVGYYPTPEQIGKPKDASRPTLHDSLNDALVALRDADEDLSGVGLEFGISSQPEISGAANNAFQR